MINALGLFKSNPTKSTNETSTENSEVETTENNSFLLTESIFYCL